MFATAMLLAQTGIAETQPRITDTVMLDEVVIISFAIPRTFVDPPYRKAIVAEEEWKPADTAKICNMNCRKCMRLQKREARKLKHKK